MNYKKIYNDIINRSKMRDIPTHYESHHILPKCLGGPNTKSNIVKLTPREHFICHLLLTKMYQGEQRQKMFFAFYRLSNRYKQKNSRFYETAKKQVKLALSKIHSGKTLTAEHRLQIKKRTEGEKNPMYGKKHSDLALKTMRDCKIGNTNAKVGINIICAISNKHLFSLPSISDLCNKFDLTRSQAEHYIYKQCPFNNMLFIRQKIITRS